LDRFESNLKIVKQNKKQGEITVRIEDLNDLWSLYNVISKGDKIVSLTSRRVVMKEGSSGERKIMKLKLLVEDLGFHEFTNRLRIKGTILEGPKDFVSYGSYHTFNIEVNNKITIIKDEWLRQDLKRLKEASKFSSEFSMIIIAIESGLANIDFITNYSHKNIASISKNIPGKRYEQSFRKKYVKDFFQGIKTVLISNLKTKDINLIVVGGPGTMKDRFVKYLRETTERDFAKNLRVVQASSGTESAIQEILNSKELREIKQKIKILQENEKIEEVLAQFGQDPDYVKIGFDEVPRAAQMGAVKQLLIADTLIRGSSKSKKLQIEDIIKNVENTSGEVDILNTNHVSGERLVDLGSLVAILRYKY
jgi:protein pelota